MSQFWKGKLNHLPKLSFWGLKCEFSVVYKFGHMDTNENTFMLQQSKSRWQALKSIGLCFKKSFTNWRTDPFWGVLYHVCWPREILIDVLLRQSTYVFKHGYKERDTSMTTMDIYTPWKFNSSPLKISNPKRKGSYSNHHFSGANC